MASSEPAKKKRGNSIIAQNSENYKKNKNGGGDEGKF
jgi:hypothetical protein